MPKFDYAAHGMIARPHADQPHSTMAPFAFVHHGTEEAPDVYAARYQARRYCERILGMHAVTVVKIGLSTRTTE